MKLRLKAATCAVFVVVITGVSVLSAPGAEAGFENESAVRLSPAPNEPVKVKAIHSDPKKREMSLDLVIEIQNRAEKPIRYIAYTLGWPSCPKAHTKPLSPMIEYGEMGPGSRKKEIGIGATAELHIPGKTLDGIAKWATKNGCASTVRPDFVLEKVVFSDGTGWEGFADGPEHRQWNGRPWTPSPVRPKSESK